jgi:hypothetical protein
MTQVDDEIREVRARLDAIAPLPDDGPVPPAAMARWLAVRAQERWARQMHAPGAEHDHAQVAVMVTEFAAAVALWALAATEHRGAELPLGLEPAVPQFIRDMPAAGVAAFIRDCWEDGGAIGEFLWEFLGAEVADAVSAEAGLLAAAVARKEAGGE